MWPGSVSCRLRGRQVRPGVHTCALKTHVLQATIVWARERERERAFNFFPLSYRFSNSSTEFIKTVVRDLYCIIYYKTNTASPAPHQEPT